MLLWDAALGTTRPQPQHCQRPQVGDARLETSQEQLTRSGPFGPQMAECSRTSPSQARLRSR